MQVLGGMPKRHPETPIDDELADLRGDKLTADGRKLDDQPRVGAMTPDADPEDDRAPPLPPPPGAEGAPRSPHAR
jgi:hypothetical protein